MEPTENIFAGNFSEAIAFRPFPDETGLPFPLNSNPAWKYSFVVLFILILVQGTRLRGGILQYMMSAEANQGPINILIWLDQLNGINSFLTILGGNVMFQLKHSILIIHV